MAVLRRYGLGLGCYAIGASLFWLLFLVALPYLLMVDYSFRPNLLPGEMGGPKDHYTLANYLALAASDVHFAVFLKTIWCSALVTILCLVACYPIAFHLAKGTSRERALRLFVLLTIPFWINEILRSFAWFIILSYQGPLNAVLMAAWVIALFWHAKLGVQVVIEDYVHTPALEIAAQLAVTFACALAALASLVAIGRIAFTA